MAIGAFLIEDSGVAIPAGLWPDPRYRTYRPLGGIAAIVGVMAGQRVQESAEALISLIGTALQLNSREGQESKKG